jgi:hypothetical protein
VMPRAFSTPPTTSRPKIEVPDGGGNGMLVTQGRFGGYGFYILNGKPIFLLNLLVDLKRIRWNTSSRSSFRGMKTSMWVPTQVRLWMISFEFNGKLTKLTLTMDPPQLSPADIQKLQEAQRNNKSGE